MVRMSSGIRMGVPRGRALAVMLGPLLVSAVGVSAALAKPSRLNFPSYDIAKFCFTDFGEGSLDTTLRDVCGRNERQARDDLRRRWSAIPARRRLDCVAAVAAAQKQWGGEGSYAGVKNCIDAPPDTAGSSPSAAQPGASITGNDSRISSRGREDRGR